MGTSLVCVIGILFVLVGAFQTGSSNTEEQEKDRITTLPGQPENVGFCQYSGYVTVNQTAGRALFYWLVEAPTNDNPESKPLVLWLSGGPGCSSVGYGSAEEIGPFRIHPDGKSLYSNPHSWNKLANLLFLESPAGVGFSYSNTPSDLKKYGDKSTAEDAYTFLVNWFEKFPQYKKRDFYMAGESYAGHYVPQLAKLVNERNKENPNAAINFKGFMLGNAVIDDYHDNVGTYEYRWANGLISNSTYQTLKKCQNSSSEDPSSECGKVFMTNQEEQGNIDPFNIHSQTCNQTSSPKSSGGYTSAMPNGFDPCSGRYSTIYFNLPEVQKALHANVTGINYPWSSCSTFVGKFWEDSPSSMLPVYKELIAAGLRIWVYSGDLDSVIPVTATRYSIDALELPTTTNWSPWSDEGQVAGWSQVYKGLTLVTIHGAGHEVPLHRPRQAFILFSSFLQNQAMPK